MWTIYTWIVLVWILLDKVFAYQECLSYNPPPHVLAMYPPAFVGYSVVYWNVVKFCSGGVSSSPLISHYGGGSTCSPRRRINITEPTRYSRKVGEYRNKTNRKLVQTNHIKWLYLSEFPTQEYIVCFSLLEERLKIQICHIL